jgi:protein-S-isoprenylcysteine O-methyltransferase Ste14
MFDMSSKSQKRESALNELCEIKAKRNRDLLIAVTVLVVMVFLVACKTLLSVYGNINVSDTLSNAIIMIAAIILAVIGGSSSTRMTRGKRRAEELKKKNNISNEEIKAYARAQH